MLGEPGIEAGRADFAMEERDKEVKGGKECRIEMTRSKEERMRAEEKS